MKNEQNNPITLQHTSINAPKVSALINLFLVNKFYIKFNQRTSEVKFDVYSTQDGSTQKTQFKIVDGKSLSLGRHSILISKIDTAKLKAETFTSDLQKLFESQVKADAKSKDLADKIDGVDPAALDKFLKSQK